ncbi:ABC-three component system middle component 6 [Geobacter metallireducens]|uniref:ABC-three component system middle component 6 n=1 Tax=Geobacter metallireducens TaxID=28232 RepID=UPI0036F437C9
MSIRTALIPHKHVRFSDSIVGLSGYLRHLLVEPHTLDELWTQVDRDSSGWQSRPSFTHLVLAVDVLYAIGAVEFVGDGRIYSVQNT